MEFKFRKYNGKLVQTIIQSMTKNEVYSMLSKGVIFEKVINNKTYLVSFNFSKDIYQIYTKHPILISKE